jgi:hypothetical protein
MAWKLSRMERLERSRSVEDVCEMRQEKSGAKGVTTETMNDDQMWAVLCDGQQGTEATAWHKAALELNRRLVVAQVEATRFQIKSTQATAWATYALVAATFFLALSSIIQAVALAVYSSGI